MMRRNIHRILNSVALGSLVLLAASNLNAAIYYVDSVNGNDSKNGLTQANAWKTLGKVNNKTLQAGDKVFLKKGSVFNQNLILKSNTTGTNANPIEITTYGSGSKPRINYQNANETGAIHLTSPCKYVEIRGIHLNNGGVIIPRANAGSGAVTQNIVLDNLDIHNVTNRRHAVQVNVKAKGTNAPPTAFKNITVRNCDMSMTWGACVIGFKILGFDVIDNNITDVGGPGIVAKEGTKNMVIRGNVVDNCGAHIQAGMAGRGSGAWVIGCEDVLVEHNSFKNAKGKLDSCGFHVDLNNKRVLIQYNLSVNNQGGFVQMLGNNHNCCYRYNISINDGWRKKGELTEKSKVHGGSETNIAHGRVMYMTGWKVQKSGGTPYQGPYNNYIYNNTIYVKGGQKSWFENRYTNDGLLIKNNIFHLLGAVGDNVGNRKGSVESGNPKDAIFANNLFLSGGTPPNNMIIPSTNEIIGNANFANAGALNAAAYIPSNTGKVKNKGVAITKINGDNIGLGPNHSLTVTEDFFGNPIIGAPDMGAIEMGGGGGAQAPVIASISNKTMDEGTSLSIPVSATDANGNNTITLTATGVPGAFGTFTDNGGGSGTIQLDPWYNANDNSPWTITITASDGNLTDTESFTLTVNDVPQGGAQAPVLTPISNKTMDEGTSLNIPVSATDANGNNTITLTATGIPGAFGTFTDNGNGSGTIQLDPWYNANDNSPWTITVTASDGNLSSSDSFTLTVNDVNRAPQLMPLPDVTMDEGTSRVIDISVTDPDEDSITLTATGIPGAFGIFTDNGNGTGTITLNPWYNANDNSPWTITVTASDGNLSDSDSFTLTVNDVNRAPTWNMTLPADPSVDENDNLVISFSATDEDGDPLSFSAAGLHSFCSLIDNGDGTGNIDCSPDYDDSGVYSITISVTDGTDSEQQIITLVVNNVNRKPWLDLINPIELEEGETISVPVNASDEDTDDVLTLTAFTMPTFGSFIDNGNGSGTLVLSPAPGDAGSYSMRMNVNDGNAVNNEANRNVQITVTLGPDYVEDFDDGLAQNWSDTTNFNPVDLGGGDYALKQISSKWKFSAYNSTISVDNGYSFSVEGRTVGTRTKSFESPTILIKYKDNANWVSFYVNEDTGTGERSIILKKKINGTVAPETTIASNITSLSGVDQWHNLEVQVNGNALNIWVNGTQEVTNLTETELSNPTFDGSTACGVRSTTEDVSLEYDNFKFYDE